MISFLNPLLLFGILGAIIPIIIHLINKKKAVSHKFAAIDFILQTNKRISVKFKLRQLILLILRASLLAFLAMALARPFMKNFIGGAPEKNVPTSNVIIVDDSYSMQYSEDNESFFMSAKTAARGVINNLTKNDDAAVITCSSLGSQVLPELDYDKKNLLNLIEQLQPGFATTHIVPALDAAVEILTSAKASIKRIFLLTDLTRNGWDIDWFKSGNEKLRSHVSNIHIVDLSEGRELKNIAVTHIEPQINVSERSAESTLKVVVSNFTPTRVKNLLAQVFLDQKKVAQGFFNIEPNASETKEFYFSVEKGKGHTGWVEISEDNLNTDNKRYFAINTSNKLDALLIDGDPKTNIYESETFYLEKALNPGREHASSIKPTICSIHEVKNFDFANFDIVFLCNVETLPPEKIHELDKFVKEGGSVIFSLGNKVDANYYNNSFGTLLPHRLHTTRTFSSDSPLSEEQPLHLKTAEPIHPALRILSETNMNTLSSVKFYRVFYVDPTPLGNCKTVLSFSDDTPAIIERQVDRGRCVLFTSSVDRDWTDMPVKPFFLPLMQQLCRFSTGNIAEEIQNETLVRHDWQVLCPEEINSLEITNPEGAKAVLQPQLIDNEKSFLYSETNIPGIYTVTVDEKPHPQFPSYFQVNVDTTEANLAKINQKELTAILGGVNLTITTSPVSEGSEVLMGEAKKTLWGTLLFLALCILFVESFVSRK
ncbi:MAG TPA: vWA domain-containing protein [Candidatus Wunengus sp. YC60]|uniref:vWA domain-containing protein n=1 Tax=Candidatus Wunengus sp. YC60 TaxID=3367697 RepID=UPI004026D62A